MAMSVSASPPRSARNTTLKGCTWPTTTCAYVHKSPWGPTCCHMGSLEPFASVSTRRNSIEGEPFMKYQNRRWHLS